MAIQFTNGFTIGSTALYPFTSFTFTTAGITGSVGPTLNALLIAYTGSSSGSYFSNPTYFTTGSFQGYQIWTVPQTATYEIEIAGAASGVSSYPRIYSGSMGAIVKARVPLTQGQKFTMVVGQRSSNTATSGLAYVGVGGGGGSFFVLSGSNTPYLVAGGAGGQGAYSGDPQGAGILRSGSLNGNGSTSTTGSNSFRGASGGTGSLGGKSHISGSTTSLNGYDGGGGGGFIGNGFQGVNAIAATSPTPGAATGGGGMSFVSGSVGGGASTSYTPASATQGGFGGGGGGGPIAGGGGGGYAGGAGTYATTSPVADGGGGGSSYIISTATTISTSDGNYGGLSTFSGSVITNLNSYNSGSGYIRITKL